MNINTIKIWWKNKNRRRRNLFLGLLFVWFGSAIFYWFWHTKYPNSMIISNEITLTEQMNEFVKNHLKNQVYSEDDLKKIFEDIDKFGYDYKKKDVYSSNEKIPVKENFLDELWINYFINSKKKEGFNWASSGRSKTSCGLMEKMNSNIYELKGGNATLLIH